MHKKQFWCSRASLRWSAWEFLSSADVTPMTVMGTERPSEPRPVSMPTGNVMQNLIRLQKTVLPIEMPTRADCFTNHTQIQYKPAHLEGSGVAEWRSPATASGKHSNVIPWKDRCPPLHGFWDGRLLHKEIGGAQIYLAAVLSLATGSQLQYQSP